MTETQDQFKHNELAMLALDAAITAGNEIMRIYRGEFEVSTKSDASPVTEADFHADEIICRMLRRECRNVPIISEETIDEEFDIRSRWESYWLVDPLDGTKEFIKQNDEFSINIAYVEDNTPTSGVVYAPAKEVAYVGSKDDGAYVLDSRALRNVTSSGNRDHGGRSRYAAMWSGIVQSYGRSIPLSNDHERPFTVAVSNSHMSDDTQRFVDQLRQLHPYVDVVSSGSALKICWVADGSVDVYPRFTETKEWDSAAGHAICLAVGADIESWPDGNRLQYNKPVLSNPAHVVKRPEVSIPREL